MLNCSQLTFELFSIFYFECSTIAVNFSLHLRNLIRFFLALSLVFLCCLLGPRRLISWPQPFHLKESLLWSISQFLKASFSFHAFEVCSKLFIDQEKSSMRFSTSFVATQKKVHRQNKKIFIVEIMSFYYFFSALLQQWKTLINQS